MTQILSPLFRLAEIVQGSVFAPLARRKWTHLRIEPERDPEAEAFRAFLDRVLYFLCARCGAQFKTGRERGIYRWHHDGAILRHLGDGAGGDLLDGLFCAFEADRRAAQAGHDPLSDARAEAIGAALSAQSYPIDRQSPRYRALRYLYDHRGEVFIRHGVEMPGAVDYTDIKTFPPPQGLADLGLSADGESYAIEHDHLPFARCAQHSRFNPWGVCGGYIALSDFHDLGGRIVVSGDRDHFYVRSSIAAGRWCFIYHARVPRLVRFYDLGEMRASIGVLKRSGLPRVDHETVRAFFTVVDHIQEKTALLRLRDGRGD